jgi:hypothetical protein
MSCFKQRKEPWRVLCPLIFPLLLAGCFEDQKQTVAKCELDTLRVYPDQRKKYSIDAENYLVLCMKASGYEFDMTHKKCQPTMGGLFVSADQPYCYVPSSPGGKIGYQIEMWMEANNL